MRSQNFLISSTKHCLVKITRTEFIQRNLFKQQSNEKRVRKIESKRQKEKLRDTEEKNKTERMLRVKKKKGRGRKK